MFQSRSASTRIILNTGAQYARAIINIIVGLYSARLILAALGVKDFGIYTLVASVISLLSFLGNSLAVTTQRFISFNQTSSVTEFKRKQIFSNSLIIHLAIASILILILEIVGLFIFDGFLNIAEERIHSAKIVYQCVIVMVICMLISSPFKALLIAYENIIFISIVEVISCLLKLGIAVYITYYGQDKLIIYSTLLMCISIVEFVIYAIFDRLNYIECVSITRQFLSGDILRSLLGFAWWTIWSQICIIGRLQGVAIILNRFFGTVVNAAYGISLQVNGVICFVSTSLNNAYSPQIMKAAGENSPSIMFNLVKKYCKFSFLLQSIIIVPLFFFCPIVLDIWLEKVPKYSVFLCRMIILTSLVDLLTFGLNTGIQAVGKIKYYSLTLNSLKLMTIPIIIILLLSGVKLEIAIATYPLIEFITAILRIPFAHSILKLDVKSFIKDVFGREFSPFIIICLLYYFSYSFISTFLEVIAVSALLSVAYLILIYIFALSAEEKLFLKAKFLVRFCHSKY